MSQTRHPAQRLGAAIDSLVTVAAQTALLISATLIVILAALGSADVIGSRLVGVAVPSAIELQEMIMAMIVFAGLASVQRRNAHIAVDLLSGQTSGWARWLLDLLALLCTIALFALLSWQSLLLARRSLAVRELSPGLVPFPLYAVKLCVFVCLVIALAAAVAGLVRLLAAPWHRGES